MKLAAYTVMLSTVPAMAFASNAFPVPEIDAMAGVAALAVVGAAVALVRDRSKR